MRPKKRVLLYCADEIVGSRLACVLDVRIANPGVIVTTTWSPKGFLDAALDEPAQFDCVVVVRSEDRDLLDKQVLALLRVEDIGKLTVEVMNNLPPTDESYAQKRVYGPIGVSIAQIILEVKLALSRKRGPKGPNAAPSHLQLMIGKAA